MLECDFCGCYSPKPEKGWMAYEYASIDEPSVLMYCPTCAAAAFGHRPDLAAEHVCTRKPLTSDAHNPGADDI
jgi:hypothetical protein